MNHPKCHIWQRGDSEVRGLVRREDLVEVANLKKPFRKKKISAMHREKLLEKHQILIENIKNMG